jgi:hypothetical protein
MVQRLAYGSPTPLIWVRILVPVQELEFSQPIGLVL